MMVVVIITPLNLMAIALVAIPPYEMRIRVIKWGLFTVKTRYFCLKKAAL